MIKVRIRTPFMTGSGLLGNTSNKIQRLKLILRVWYLLYYTVCPGSSDPFYILTYYIKWIPTSWTDGINSTEKKIHYDFFCIYRIQIFQCFAHRTVPQLYYRYQGNAYIYIPDCSWMLSFFSVHRIPGRSWRAGRATRRSRCGTWAPDSASSPFQDTTIGSEVN